MNRNLQNTADQLRLWLTANGCKVRTGQVRHTPLLMVTGPLPPEMTRRAVWGREYLAGQVSDVAMVRFGGCVLHWRQ
ncbi:hypothetical protein [Aeromonas rivipollensis]|jgi:hypothetical protein|uniref:hypothetical protein n=1 Tax=Aeromonas rivipollensis TaxID=948519 RepID=UPI003D219CD4